MVVLDEVDKLFEHDARSSSSSYETHSRDGEGSGSGSDYEEHSDSGDRATKKSSFLTQIDDIFSHCPATCQRGLFSATVSSNIQDLASNVLTNPIYITIGTANAGASTIDQKLLFVGREDGKLLAIRQLVQQGLTPPVLIFMQVYLYVMCALIQYTALIYAVYVYVLRVRTAPRSSGRSWCMTASTWTPCTLTGQPSSARRSSAASTRARPGC